MKVDGKNGVTWRASIGLGLPLSNGLINVAFFFDRLQLTDKMLQNNTFGVSVTYTISERLYKVKLQ